MSASGNFIKHRVTKIGHLRQKARDNRAGAAGALSGAPFVYAKAKGDNPAKLHKKLRFRGGGCGSCWNPKKTKKFLFFNHYEQLEGQNWVPEHNFAEPVSLYLRPAPEVMAYTSGLVRKRGRAVPAERRRGGMPIFLKTFAEGGIFRFFPLLCPDPCVSFPEFGNHGLRRKRRKRSF